MIVLKEAELTPVVAAAVPMLFSTDTMCPPSCVNACQSSLVVFGLTFGNTALETGIEGISREQSDQLRLLMEPRIATVVVAQCLEPGYASHRVTRSSFDMIDIVEVQDAQVRRRFLIAFFDGG